MSEELTEVASAVAPAVAPVAESAAQEVPTTPADQLPPPPAEIPVETAKPEAAAEPQTQYKKIALDPNPTITVSEREELTKRPPLRRGQMKPQKQRKPAVSTADRKAMWKKNILERGEFKQEFFIDALTDFASKNRGYDSAHWWGGTLITMFNRLSEKCRTKLRTFSPSDVEYATTKLMKFMVEKPLGATVAEWNTNYHSNGEQRRAVDSFFGVDLPLYKIHDRDLIFIQFRNAAWPSKKEEEKNIGGSFAERFHYLISAVLKFLTTSQEYIDAMFEVAYHTEPPAEYTEFVNKTRQSNPALSWIGADGKCADCGSDIVTDANGNQICSNPICIHNVAVSTHTVPKDFGQFKAGHPQRREGNFSRPDMSSPDKGPRRDWKGKKDRRHGDDEMGDDVPRRPKFKKRGPRFHANEGDEDIQSSSAQAEEAVTVSSTPGSESFGSMAGLFDGIKV